MSADILRLDAGEATLAILARSGAPARILYLGPALPAGADLAALETLTAEGPRESQPDDPRPVSLAPTGGFGFLGAPALVVADATGAVPLDPVVTAAAAVDGALRIDMADETVRIRIDIARDGGLFRWSAAVDNLTDAPLALATFASLTLPAPPWVEEIGHFAGRWGGEHRLTVSPFAPGALFKESRGGRPGFESAHYLVASAAGAGEETGRVLALALCWSGEGRLLAEHRLDGVRQLQIGARLEIGEAVLPPGASYAAPDALVAFTTRGRNSVRAAFHPVVGAHLAGRGARKVHFNTWEAAYFDVSAARLPPMIEAAAALGAERFVLDDGWFKGRRDDSTSLGDWVPDPERFPEGLAPIAALCAAHGLEFGLWVEPEMVSPRSDLARAHPEWILGAPAAPAAAPTQRKQLVLDFSRADVRDHVVATLDALLAAAPIAYLKWDHNRELFPVRSAAGPGAGTQTRGVYDVIDRLRARWPDLEIEACASGGARADLGMLARTHRLWASDDVDALERARIQRDLSLFVPPAMIGAHVGASPDHTTGRRLPMLTRARVALFFHMGVEADPSRLSEADRADLAAAIADYKACRADLHAGVFRVLETTAGVIAWQTFAPGGARGRALALRLDHAPEAVAAPVRLAGLDPEALYCVRVPEPWPKPAARRLAHPDLWRAGVTAPGRVWMEQGVPVPLVHPGAAWLLDIEKV